MPQSRARRERQLDILGKVQVDAELARVCALMHCSSIRKVRNSWEWAAATPNDSEAAAILIRRWLGGVQPFASTEGNTRKPRKRRHVLASASGAPGAYQRAG